MLLALFICVNCYGGGSGCCRGAGSRVSSVNDRCRWLCFCEFGVIASDSQ